MTTMVGGRVTNDFSHTSNLGTEFGSQVTDSENHPWPSKGTGDVGGEFYTQKKYILLNPAHVSGFRRVDLSSSSYETYRFNGYLHNVYPPYAGYFPPAKDSSVSSLNQAGTKAVALCMPTNSLINLSTFLGELLKDGLPRASAESWKAGTIRARKAGDDYLNAQFGWKPIANDIARVALLIDQAERTVAQFERDAGKWVRRRFSFPRVLTNTLDRTLTTYEAPYVGIYAEVQRAVHPGQRSTRVSTQFSQDRWFSGAFTYHLPSDWNSRGAMRNARSQIRHALSVDLDPETVWNLTPWSWAIDWFSSTGDVVHNLNAWSKYGLVMRYGYMMEHTLNRVDYDTSYTGPQIEGQVPASVTPSTSFITETKRRVRANPFGFGVSWNGLDKFQLSIAAALGLSRSSK